MGPPARCATFLGNARRKPLQALLPLVDCRADFAQRTPQFLLLRAPLGEFGQRKPDAREHRHDRHDHEQLHQREATPRPLRRQPLHRVGEVGTSGGGVKTGGADGVAGLAGLPPGRLGTKGVVGKGCAGIVGKGWSGLDGIGAGVMVGGDTCGGKKVGVWPGCGIVGTAPAGRAPGTGAPSWIGEAPTEASVPDRNSCSPTPGSSTLRTMCGVTSRMISVRTSLSLDAPKSLLMSGTSLSPGTPVLDLRSSRWMSPASTLVSPSRTRSVVEVFLVPSR